MLVSLPQTLVIGYGIGIVLAALLTTLAIGSRIGADLLETLTSMFNPLPAVGILPLALIWFGLGTGSVIFVLVHSVLWAIALNTHAGFRSVSSTLLVGQNYEPAGLELMRLILIPAAFPAILTGLKVGWAIAAAHADRGRACLRRILGLWRAGLVHLREPQSARDGQCLRRPVHRHPDRPLRRERHLRHHRAQDDPSLGHAALTLNFSALILRSAPQRRVSKDAQKVPETSRASFETPLRGSSG